MFFRQLFDPCLAQYAYLIGCQATGEAIVIDPERDIDTYLTLAEHEGLRLVAVAETHIHADFLSGARALAERVGARVYLSSEGESAGWGSNWAKNSNYSATFLKEGDTFKIGNITFSVIKTPGHTPEHLSYLVTEAQASTPLGMISGDFLFVGDLGRPDLLETAANVKNTAESAADALYTSAKTLIETIDQDDLLIWPAHGAGSACGKGLGAVPHSTLGYEKRQNRTLAKVREGHDAFIDYILEGQPEPPYYFARMKTQNRDGVPLLKDLPNPRSLSVQELAAVVQEGKLLPLDTREDKMDFLRQHLPQSLFVPFYSNFCTSIGSLVEEETTPILLIVSPEHQQEAIRRLIRIGYDNIEAVASLDTLSRYFINGGASTSIPTIDFAAAETMRQQGATVVDLRFQNEYTQGHLPHAIHAPYTRLIEHLKHIPSDQPVIAHCHSGLRAAISSAFLQRNGYQVVAVNDSINNYRQIGELIKETSHS
ncbi:MAG: MBL fold metallo-hydrolase [Chlamydiia bacterium]|nr:MBL fold metallo-hydrolase [Chlamydiia bacterium]